MASGDVDARIAELEDQIASLSRRLNDVQDSTGTNYTGSGALFFAGGRASLIEADAAAYFSTNKLVQMLEADTATSYDLWRFVNGRYAFNPTVAGQRDMYEYFTNNGNSSEWGVYLASNTVAPTTVSALRLNKAGGLTVTSTAGGASSTTTVSASGLSTDNLTASGFVQLTGFQSPSQITSDQNDYDPVPWAGLPANGNSAIWRLTSDAARNITGIAVPGLGGGTVLILANAGSYNIVLKDESASSTAANRFALTGDITLIPDACCLLQYDGTSSRWRAISAPGAKAVTKTVISTLSRESIGVDLAADTSGVTSATWPTANLAIIVPFQLEESVTFTKMGFRVAVQSGNYDIGIYNEAYAKQVSMGSTAVPAVGLGEADITNTTLAPGRYYFALAFDNTTVSTARVAPVSTVAAMMGCAQMASAFPLPSTFTPATMAVGYVPVIAASIRTLLG